MSKSKDYKPNKFELMFEILAGRRSESIKFWLGQPASLNSSARDEGSLVRKPMQGLQIVCTIDTKAANSERV